MIELIDPRFCSIRGQTCHCSRPLHWPYNLPRGGAMNHVPRSSRRQLLRMSAALGGGWLAQPQKLLAWDTPGKLGAPLGPYGERSPFEKAVRWHRDSKTPETGSSFTPLQTSVGTITPSSLH